ncbi:cytochrome P450 [Favolaschia claudopus]|uniref:Cytochrome P450 n=1 Tax=Favolaschia claudopus TaxID=2862362 RepID=A0AAW0E2F6_9AGAR
MNLLATELSVGLICFLVYRKLYTAWKDRGPPGPRGLPIIGNMLQIRKLPWITFTTWTREYGPIYRINIGGQNAIILGSTKVASDILDRRSGITGDRPQNIVTRILTGDLIFAFSQIGQTWRRMRKASHDALGPQIAKNYHSLQEREAIVLVDEMIQTPLQFNAHIKRASASIVMSIIYGIPIADSKDPIVMNITQFVDRALGAAAPGAFLVEYFTWMQYLPRWMSGWRRYAEFWYQQDSVMLTGLFSKAQTRREKGEDGPSVAAALMDSTEKDALTLVDSAWLSATLYAAGAETSAGQMEWFMISMLLHPEVQTAAQRQLDDVVGRGRMPTFADYDHLPYIRAIVKEVLRWRTVLPIGLPHRVSEDDWYEGFFIAKDSILIPNIWGMNHDPAIYGEDAEAFRPERHLTEDGILASAPKDTKDESHCSYGFGKRICVGRHVANRSLFIEMATILWIFNILPSKDHNGNPMLPDARPTRGDSLNLRPAPFQCEIVPRFENATEIVAQAKSMIV